MTMAENMRTGNILPLTTISEEEQLQEIMDTTEYPCTTTTTPNLVLTPLQNVSTTSAPSAPSILTNALELAGRTLLLNKNRVAVTPRPTAGQTPRSRQGSGDTAGRGRKKIAAARGDVAAAAEKYYTEMLKLQEANCKKYEEYLTQKIVNKKA